MGTVQTYRVARGEILVGHSVRTVGDFVPEADMFESLHSYITTQTLEICYVDEEVLSAFKKKIAAEKPEEIITESSRPASPTVKRIIKKKKRVENVGANAGTTGATGTDDGGASDGEPLPEHSV